MNPSLLPPLRIPAFPPPWAEVFGEDEAGIFAEFEVAKVRFVLRWIRPGNFMMGSPKEEEGRYEDEGPPHEVTISQGFWLGETPVTQAQWRAVMGDNPSRFEGPDELPAERVSWHDSQKFVRKLAAEHDGLFARLPSEAQWEYACRAGTDTAFNNGSACTLPTGKDPALDELGWFNENSEGKTHPVKGKLPNRWGLYDMHGNVWEWCEDAWEAAAYQNRRDGATDPRVTSADENAGRVVRGGAWYSRARLCRAASRSAYELGFRRSDLGLRLAAGREPGAAEPPGAERPPGG
ncbi:MAG: formylglycine-generating enzyme family protein [Verrucomicrobia bacterium]|nr:formylglycine-generating enzyme family protein [Verrucomicrobiota bacterium]